MNENTSPGSSLRPATITATGCPGLRGAAGRAVLVAGLISAVALAVPAGVSGAQPVTHTSTSGQASSANGLSYYYNHDGSPTWSASPINYPHNAVSRPAIVHSDSTDNTEIAVQGANHVLYYFYNHDGTAG